MNRVPRIQTRSVGSEGCFLCFDRFHCGLQIHHEPRQPADTVADPDDVHHRGPHLHELDRRRDPGILLFVVAGVTDWLDGLVARRQGLVSTFGILMDALTDKVLMLGLMIALVDLDKISIFLVLLILGREFMITGMRLVAATKGVVVSAERSGKLKTLTQIISIGAFLLADMVRTDLHGWLGMDMTVLAQWADWAGMGLFIPGNGIYPHVRLQLIPKVRENGLFRGIGGTIDAICHPDPDGHFRTPEFVNASQSRYVQTTALGQDPSFISRGQYRHARLAGPTQGSGNLGFGGGPGILHGGRLPDEAVGPGSAVGPYPVSGPGFLRRGRDAPAAGRSAVGDSG